MKLGFEKLLEEHDIEVENLPNDLQISIEELQNSKERILAKTRIGHNVNEQTLERLRVKDQMVVRALLELIEDEDDDNKDDEDEDKDDDTMGNNYNEEDEDEDDDVVNVSPQVAIAVDKELNSLFSAGVTTVSLSELRSRARNTYNLLWDSYEQDSENGIATSNFELIETNTNTEEFNLTKL